MTEHVEVPVPEEAKRAAFEALKQPFAAADQVTRSWLDAVLEAAAPFIAAKAVEEKEKQLRECEEAWRSAEANYAQFRDDMLNELRGDMGNSIETLSWDQLLGVAVRNGNAAMKAEDERDQAVQQERGRLREAFFNELEGAGWSQGEEIPTADLEAAFDRIRERDDQEGDGDV